MFSPHSPPPPSLLYDKYIKDCTKSGEIHLKAIEIYKNNVIVYMSMNGKNCTSRCVFIYSRIITYHKRVKKIHSM